jgi:hypothetical protein
LRHFVGLRIGAVLPDAQARLARPT